MAPNVLANILAAMAFTMLTSIAEAVDLPVPNDCTREAAGPVLTLKAAADRLESCNAGVLQARAAYAAAQADIITADHTPNPTLGLGISNINPKAGIGDGTLADRTVDSAIRVDQLIERGGKRAARRNAAYATANSSEQALRDAELRSQQDLLEAYVNTAAAEASLDLLTQAAASYRQSVSAMERRLTAGDVARIEKNRVELDAARAEADAATAATAVAQARADLSTAISTPQLASDIRLMTLDQLASLRVNHTIAIPSEDQLLQERPDVKSAAARLDAARSSLTLARAGQVNDVDVTLGFDHWPVSATNTQGTGNSFTIGASVPLRIFDTGRGVVGHAAADVNAAESELRRSQDAAAIELRTAQNTLATTEALAARYRSTLLPNANQILEAEEAAYRRGGASLLDLLDARRNARQVALAAVAAQRDAEIAAGRLALATGQEPLTPFLHDAIATRPGQPSP